MRDPALGNTRAQRALGEFYQTANPGRSHIIKQTRGGVNDKRHVGMGQYDGVKPGYGRYNVSEQAQDVLNRSIRNRGER